MPIKTYSFDMQKKVLRGTEALIESLFEQWYEPLVRYAMAMLHSQDVAEDVVQQVFEKLWTKRVNIAIHTSAKSLLYRSVHNACLDELRKNKVRQNFVSMERNQTEQVVDQQLENKELGKQIAAAIDDLPAKCKQVFVLARQHEMSYAEIANTLEISNKTVENHMGKALKTLRARLAHLLGLGLILLQLKGW